MMTSDYVNLAGIAPQSRPPDASDNDRQIKPGKYRKALLHRVERS